jgi:uncharacterized membrane protein
MAVRMSWRAPLLFLGTIVTIAALQPRSAAQTPAQTKKPPAGPAAPQSTHFPILLLAFGNDPSWSVRIGQKGPERLDRPGYPPVPLDPVDVNREGATDAWNYRAKDSATGAEVSVHLTREACTADASGTKYTFRAVAQHAQIGALNGCARIAAELFPKISNQTDDDDDAEKKPPQPLPADVIKFKLPIAFAYLNPAGKIVFKRGAQSRLVTPDGGQLDVSHDGQRLLYAREEKGGDQTILLYDFSTGRVAELLRGSVQEPFWSPDDTHFAFLKLIDSHWNLFVAPIAAPDSAVAVYSGDLFALHGWADAHTILASNLGGLYWIGDDGRVQQTLSSDDLYGSGQFGVSAANKVRINPVNPDLLLVSAEMLKPPPGTPTDPHTGAAAVFFLYEVRAKRRSLLSPPNMYAQNPEWSRDGVQVFFTNRDSPRSTSIYKIFWDGSQPKRYLPGSDFVVGQ